MRAHANSTIFSIHAGARLGKLGPVNFFFGAEGAGDGLAVGAGCPISEIYFGSDAALKHVFKGIPGMVAW